MANTLPENFPVPSEPAVASYDYRDIADGAGIVEFYGYHSIDNTTEKYGLTDTALYSNYIWTSETANNAAAFAKELDLDFDLSAFNTPRTIKGTGTFVFSFGSGSVSTAGTQSDIYVIIKVRKWDGSTETEIANGQSETDRLGNLDGNGYYDYRTVNVQITIPETEFKIGEQLRVTVELWAQQIGANACSVFFFHSPKDISTTKAAEDTRWLVPSDSSAGYGLKTSQFIAKIPFKIDL